MKYLTRFLSVFLCCVLSFGVFSISVSAESSTLDNLVIEQNSNFYVNGGYQSAGNSLTFYPNNGQVEKREVVSSPFTLAQLKNSFYVRYAYSIYSADNSVLLEGGKSYKVSFNNVYNSVLLTGQNVTTDKFYIKTPVCKSIIYYFTDGTYQSVYDFQIDHKTGDPYFNAKFSIQPEKDVYKILMYVHSPITDNLPSTLKDTSYTITTYTGEFNGDDKHQFSFEVESQEAGLLKSVIEWLKSIKDGITNLFESIAELPNKLWQLIENGLKSLFVPDDEFIVNFKNDIELMLSEKLGAVYQVIDILADSWDRISVNDIKNTITIPSTTITLPEGNSFNFGGYEVKIVPDKFSFLATAVKTAVGIASTVLFVNGLRKKYDDVIGGS